MSAPGRVRLCDDPGCGSCVEWRRVAHRVDADLDYTADLDEIVDELVVIDWAGFGCTRGWRGRPVTPVTVGQVAEIARAAFGSEPMRNPYKP